MGADAASLYDCQVMHRRHVAPSLRFRYRLFYLLLDVDRLDALSRALRLFSHNGFNLVSVHDRDHGSGAPGGLRAWAQTVLQGAGIALPGGRIRLLCLPRVLSRLPVRVSGDSVQLQQVIVNLLLNAIDATAQRLDGPRRSTVPGAAVSRSGPRSSH